MGRMSVSRKLMVTDCLLVLGMTVLMGALLLPAQLQSMESDLEDEIAWTARLLAEDGEVKEALGAGRVSGELMEWLDGLSGASEDVDYIVVAGKDSIRLYHPDHSRIGEPFSGGDEGEILAGGEPYISTSLGSSAIQRRAFHGVYSREGEVLGFVMASASLSTIRQEQREMLLGFAGIFAVILSLGLLSAGMIAGNIRKSLLGFEPRTFARMFLQREEILDKLAESIAAVDREGRVLYANSPARKLLGEGGFPEGSELGREVKACLGTGDGKTEIMTQLGDSALLASIMPFGTGEEDGGMLVIMHDRTEVVRMGEQIAGMNHMVEALRANTHEYLNRLHIISGLLQVGAVDEAVRFIDRSAAVTRGSCQVIVSQIEDRTVAALLLGKTSRAAELDILFSLRRDSFLAKSSPYLTTRELVVILGNLVENAFDAAAGAEGVRQVEVFVQSSSEGIVISVTDTGCGMTAEQIRRIRAGRYSTKGEGRGTGMQLVQEIIRERKGYLEIESEPGVGTVFTAGAGRREADDTDRDCGG